MSLARFFGLEKLVLRIVRPSSYAHLVVDVQRHFCDPAYSKFGTHITDAVACNIASITPVFREAGMPTYMIYYQKWNEPPEKCHGGFHRVRPAASDILFGKIMPSAFEYTDLAKQLNESGIKTLLVSGFDIENCVNATVQDALREEFNVWVLSDCVGNGGPPVSKTRYLKLMIDHGAELISSREAQRRLAQPQP